MAYLLYIPIIIIKMADLFKWPRIWFEIFLKPEETAASLKKEKPGWIDGVASFGFCSFSIGLIAFIISTILAILLGFSLGTPLTTKVMSMGIGLLIMFGIFVIAFPILMIILLLILTIFLKIASMLLKGKGGFSEECGILGIVGSSYLILMVLLMVAIYTPMLLVFAISGPGGFGVVMALMYLIMGVAYLIFMPLVYLIMAFTFDLLADIEQISIYRSGAIVGLMFGIIMFLMMLMLSAMMFLIGGAMSNFSGMLMAPSYYR